MNIFDGEKIAEKLLPFSEFDITLTADGGFPAPDSENGRMLIEEGEKALDYEIEMLPLSKYRMFCDNGDRMEYERPYFRRRENIIVLMLAELCEKKGRFIGKMMDILLAVCEESTWVVPAHNHSKINHITSVNDAMLHAPMAETGDVWVIDLFSGHTGAVVALCYHYFKEQFEREIPSLFNARLLYEVERRIIKPYLEYCDYWWMGFVKERQTVNNWNPWINANVLAAAMCTVKDDTLRRAVATKTAKCINNYIESLPEDLGCDEGPGYWGAACGNVVTYAELLYAVTGGKYSVFDSDIIREMVKYVQKAYISDDYYFCHADGHAKTGLDGSLIRRVGKLSDDYSLYCFGNDILKRRGLERRTLAYTPLSRLLSACDSEVCPNADDYEAPLNTYLPSLEIVSAREYANTKKGFFLGFKGGSNGESHNHLDVGEFIVYDDGKPLFIDMGVGTYTKYTFQRETRYKQFGIGTEFHNVAMINDIGQGESPDYKTKGFSFDGKVAKAQLENAYANRDDIVSYTREASLENGIITVKDELLLKEDGKAEFLIHSIKEPKTIGNARLELDNTVLSFSEGAEVSVEVLELSDASFSNAWETDKLWRIRARLCGKEIKLVTTLTHK